MNRRKKNNEYSEREQLPIERQLLPQHCKPLVWIVGTWLVLLGLLFPIVHFHLHERLLFSQWWCSSCVVFLLAWWIVYAAACRIRPFRKKLPTLREFLEEASTLRRGTEASKLEGDDIKDVREAIVTRSSAAPATIGLLMATIALFFVVISGWPPPIDDFQRGLRLFVYAVGGLSVMLLLISVEAFDTVANLFRPQATNHRRADIAIKRYFYDSASEGLYSGGYPAFMLFLVLSLSFINPFIAGILVAAFAWLGYPYWWRGWIEVNACDQSYDIQEVKGFHWVGRALGIVIGGATILFWCLSAWCPSFTSLAW